VISLAVPRSLAEVCSAVAHELRSPVQFIGDSVSLLASALETHAHVLRLYAELANVAANTHPEAVARIRAAEAKADFPFFADRTPRALARIDAGLQRITELSEALGEAAKPSRGAS
jgi:signal transduction histidine kinase